MAARKHSHHGSTDGHDASPAASRPFDQLYRDNVDVMYRFAYRLCGEAEAAKDLVQETFLNAYQALGRWRPQARFSTWLFQIARNLDRKSVV